MTKVFVLGATGYIGGTIISQLAVAYPSLEITILARSAAKGAEVTAQYPTIAVAIGDLNSVDVITAQSALADIVINAADCDHEASAVAVNHGLEKRGGGYLIHTSGIGMLWDAPHGSVLTEKIWDDIADLEELKSFPIEAVHRPVEKIVLEAPASVRTAIISPGKLYGVGTGPVKKYTTPFIASTTIINGEGFQIGTGAATMGTIHVLDLARLYVLLVGEALKPNGGSADWGADGYYFGVVDEVSIAQHSGIVAEELAALGHIKSKEVAVYSIEKAAKINPFMPYLYGASARARASRAKKLGWKPVELGVLETLRTDIREEYAVGRPVQHWGALLA